MRIYWEADPKLYRLPSSQNTSLRKFDNKFEALREANGKISRVKFCFFEEAFDKLDWTKEPLDDWETMLATRAQQLRDTYSYLRLWYSGGVDSHTALLTFLKAGIPLDEIATHQCSPIDDYNDPGNIEVANRAIPFLKFIEKKIPHTKITVLNIGSKEFQKIFSDKNEDIERWFLHKNDWDVRSVISTPSLYYLFPELEAPARGHTLADIIGEQKPRLRRGKDGTYYATHLDHILTYHTGRDAKYNEYFYITPDYPELHLKQCHLLKNTLKENHPDMYDLDPFWKNPGPYVKEYNEGIRYPCWNEVNLGKVDFPEREGIYSWVASKKGYYVLKTMKNYHPEIFQRFTGQFEYVETKFLKYFNDPTQAQSHISALWGKEYNIGK